MQILIWLFIFYQIKLKIKCLGLFHNGIKLSFLLPYPTKAIEKDFPCLLLNPLEL